MNKILLCTVGTSLFTNYRKIQEQSPDTISLQKESIRCLNDRNYIGFSRCLLKENEGNNILGAEICSIYHIMKNGKIPGLDNIVFLASDTGDGKAAGEVLSRYYNDSEYNTSGRKNFAQSDVIEKLNDLDSSAFKNAGLRNLVRIISEKYRLYGKDRIIINATGGYKAQILFAGVVGQSLGIPVFYLFERFNEIIELPPQPVSFDPQFWIDNQDIFFALNKSGYVGTDFDEKWFNNKDPRFDTLINIVKDNKSIYLTLSPTGEIFHQMFLIRFQQNNIKLPPEAGKQEQPHIGVHHMPKGIDHYLDKLTAHFPFIIRCSTISLNNKPATNMFAIKSHNNRLEITGLYSNDFTVNFIIQTTAKNIDEMTKAVIYMNENIKKQG